MFELKGRNVLPALAEIYRQLNLVPGDEGAELYRDIVFRGKDAPVKSLEHFNMDDRDSCYYEKTPAGEVMVVTLNDRHDFETFLQIMAEKCVKTEIPDSQGASIIDGIVNWGRINAYRDEFYRDNPGADFLEWSAAFKEFQKDKRNYTDALIVLSAGPYSAVPAQTAGLGEDEWLERSAVIRKYHECTHFICRRMFSGQIDAVWDELVADAVGIYAAFGKYDHELEELLLGISGGRYAGGRLENYVKEPSRDAMDELAEKVHSVLLSFVNIADADSNAGPYELALLLQAEKGKLWQI